MSSSSTKTRKKADQLPPLSPSPPRSSKERDAHVSTSDGHDRTYTSLPNAALRLATLATIDVLESVHDGDHHIHSSSASTLMSHNADALPYHNIALLRGAIDVETGAAQDLQGSYAGSSAPPLSRSTTSGLQGSHSGYSLAKTPAPAEEEDGGGAQVATAPQLTTSGERTTQGEQHQQQQLPAPLQRRQSNSTSSSGGVGYTSQHVARNAVFSSVEHAPHVPVPLYASVPERRSSTVAATTSRLSLSAAGMPEDTVRGIEAAAAAAATTTAAVAAPQPVLAPYDGVFLQPSTFRIGATGEDVLWALYQTNGVVASYLDPPSTAATQRCGSGDCSGCPSPPATTGPSVTLATHTAASLQAEASANASATSASNGGSVGNGGNQGVPSFADVEAEIARCLNGAGSSTPCLLTFDYVVRPARFRHLSDAEATALRHHPLTAQLHAAGVNRLEEVVPGSSQQPEYSQATNSSGSDVPATRDGAPLSPPPPQQLQQQQQRQRWMAEILPFPTSAEGGEATTTDIRRLRRRACAEVVQSCLHAARRAGTPPRGRLFLTEPLSSERGGEGCTRGTVHQLLSGSTVAEGSRLLPSPLWSGVHIALATMLVGESATFVLGCEDTTRYAAPVDGPAYIRGGAAGATATAGGAASMPRTGGCGTPMWPAAAGDTVRRLQTINFTSAIAGATGDHREMTFAAPHTRHRASPRNHAHTHGHERTGRRRRSRSNSTASRHRSSSAASATSARTSSSSRASSGDAGVWNGPQRTPATAPQTPQQPTQPPQRKPSNFLSRVRDWRKKGRSPSTAAAGEGDKTKERNEKPREEPPQPQPQPPQPHTSPTRTYPPPRRHGGHGSQAPTSTPSGTPTTASSIADTPFTPATVSGLVQPTPRPPPRVGTPTHACPAALPSCAPTIPDDVRAYEAAMHAAAEPMLVELTLRARVPLLPTRSTSVLPSLLVSAASVAAASVGDSSTGEALTTPSPPTCAPAGSAYVRAASNLSTGAVSAITTATSAQSEAGQRRGLMTDALLCLSESNLMRPRLATTFHYLLHRSEGKGRGGCNATTASRHGFPSSPHRRASTSTSSTSSTTPLTQLMSSVLDRAEVRNASRAALFCAMMYVMDGKLLNTRDRARVLDGGVAEWTRQEPLGGAPESGESGEDTAAVAAPAPQLAPPATSVASSPSSYLWLPYFRAADVFITFARHWHSGAFVRGRAATKAGGGNNNNSSSTAVPPTSAISSRALQRALEEFTRYGHDTATVAYSVAVYNAVTQTYDPYCSPLQRATSSPSSASPGADGLVIRSCIGCVMHPCWLDAVLQASPRRPSADSGGTDVYVVTRGHAAEAEERLFICGVLSDITATALDAAAAFSPSRASAPECAVAVDAAASAAAGSDTVDVADGGVVGRTLPSPRAPTTPSGTSTRPTPATVAALTPRKSVRSTVAEETSVHTRTRSRTTVDASDKAEAAARRSLESGRQLLRRRVGEQQYRVHIAACAPVLNAQHFFVTSPKEGLAAARALLVDSAVLLDYYYRVMDSFAEQRTTTGGAISSSSSFTPRALHLAAAVPPALRDGNRLSTRGQQSRQRLPYLLFGEDRAAILAAASARAVEMGGAPRFCSSPTTTAAITAGAVSGSSGHSDGAVSPPIEVLAAALMLFSPAAATAVPTLSSRIPLALERILLKVLPMLYLAVFLLSFGVDEGEVAPTALLEHVYGAWWTQAAAAPGASSQRGAADTSVPAGAAAAAASPSSTPPPLSSAVAEEHARALYRRYTYLGECFHALALVYAELPGLRAMGWGACCTSLFYCPRDAALWALLATFSDQQGNTHEAATARRVAVQLLTTAGEKAVGQRAGNGADGEQAAMSGVLEDGEGRRHRSALLQHLRGYP